MEPSNLLLRVRTKFYILFNRYKLKKHGATIGRNLMVYDGIYLKGNGRLIIGDNFKFTSGDGINAISRNIKGSLYTDGKNASIEIGDDVGISSSCLWARDSIKIGNHVKIGACCVIIDNDAHPHDYIKRRNDYPTQVGMEVYNESIPKSPIVIEEDVWIGAQCQILKGVRIGARSIIAAGSVVTKDIPSDCIAGGNPCIVIKPLITGR